MVSNELQGVLEGYRLSPRAELEPHRSVWLVDDGQNLKVLKPLKTGAVRSFLIGELLKEINEGRRVPDLIPTERGHNYLWFRGNRYFLTRWLDGREADYYRDEDLAAAIGAMRWFHESTGRLVEASSCWEYFRFQPGREWNCYLREMEACRRLAIRRGDGWCRQYLRLWPAYYEQAYHAIDAYRSMVKQAGKCLCYHDWAHHNVVIREGKACLFDFDYLLMDNAVHDKANLISRYARLHHWDYQYLLKILWLFDKHYPWKKGELRLLHVYLTFPYDYWMFGRQFLIEQLPWSRRYLEEQWQRKAAWISRRNRALEILEALEA